MWRKKLGMVAALAAVVGLAACETVTELGEARMAGTWDGVGALQSRTGGLQLDLQQAPDGTFGGTWKTNASSGQVVQGVNEGGVIHFVFLDFDGTPNLHFSGELTNAFRIEGTIDGYQLEGPAVFRKGPAGEQ
jgi:hypothetical protein